MFRWKIGAIFAIAGGLSAPLLAQFFGVVPNDRANQAGTGVFLWFTTTDRTYQWIIHQDQLTSLVGLELIGITWRLPASATTPWPPTTNADFSDFRITLGPGVDPAARSSTFANNYSGPTTEVRSGPLTIPVGAYPATGTPRDWGFEILFQVSYLYTGGHLTMTINRTAMTGNTTGGTFDAVTTTTPGWGTQYASIWATGFNPATGGNANFIITRFTAVPEPATIAGAVAGLLVLLRRRRRD